MPFFDPHFSHPDHPRCGIQVMQWWARYSHYTVMYEIPATPEGHVNFWNSFRGWTPGTSWEPFDKTQVKRVVIDWQELRPSRPGFQTILVQCRYEEVWSPL